MFEWLKRRSPRAADEDVATQPPGEVFPWPKGAVLTAVDQVVLALPTALIEKDRPISECVFGPPDMEISIPKDGDRFFLRLMPGMSVSLAKPCQSYVVADDNKPRRLRVSG